jgi:hypothetical protein
VLQVLHAPVARRVVRVALLAARVHHAQQVPVVLVAHVQVLVAQVPAQVLVLQVPVVLPALVRVPVAAAAVAVLQVLSVRAVRAVPRRLASRSVRSAKSLNKEWLRASVAQLCLVATAPPSFVFVVEQASRTSQTRLMPMLVS